MAAKTKFKADATSFNFGANVKSKPKSAKKRKAGAKKGRGGSFGS